MLQFCTRLSFNFASTQKYAIKKLNYLIEAPPTRPASAYAIFTKQKTEGQKNVISSSKQRSDVWKKLSQKQKNAYTEKSNASRPEYEKLRDAYTEKYVVPFKRVSVQNLFLKHLYANKLVKVPEKFSIGEMGKIVGEKMKTMSKADQQKFSKEAKTINDKRKAQIEKFKFPTRLYHSQVAHTRAHPKLYTEQRRKAYRTYVRKWQSRVENWLEKNKYNMTISEFKRLYNRELKKKSSKKEEPKEEEVKKEAKSSK